MGTDFSHAARFFFRHGTAICFRRFAAPERLFADLFLLSANSAGQPPGFGAIFTP